MEKKPIYEAMAGTRTNKFLPYSQKRGTVGINGQHTFVVGDWVNICETGQIGNEEEVVEQLNGAGLLL